MKIRMSGKGGWIFCLIPCHENMQSSVGYTGRRSKGRKWIQPEFDIIHTQSQHIGSHIQFRKVWHTLVSLWAKNFITGLSSALLRRSRPRNRTENQQFRPQQKCEQTVGIGQGLACLNTKSAKSEDIVLVYFQQFLWPWNRLEDMLDKKNGIRSRKWN